MMPGPVSKRFVADQLAWIEKMVAVIRELLYHAKGYKRVYVA